MTPAFTSHNVALPGGSYTVPGRPLVSGTGVCQAALRYLEHQFPSPPDVTVADLGCLEGGYAAEFARAGYDVTGIDARQENYDRAVWLQEELALPNLRFYLGDVRDALIDAPQFDAVFCSGLLYHLDKPVEFINLLGKVTRKLLILNTHYSAGPVGHSEHLHQPGERCEYDGSENEGMAGHWFYETENQWASFGNPRSFWLTKPALTEALYAAGFGYVEEMTDWHNSATMAFGSGGETGDRGMFVAVKK